MLTFAPGETEKTANVPVIDDDIEDSGETVGVNLNNPTRAVIDRERAIGTILNEDVLADNNSEATLTVGAEPMKSHLDTVGHPGNPDDPDDPSTEADHDWFKVTLPAAPDDPYYIEVKGISTNYASLFDPKVMLRDSTGEEVASDNNSGSGRNARLKFTNTTEGTYIIDVYSAEPARTGSYMVTVSTKGDDCLATTSTTCTLVLGNHRPLNHSGEIEVEGDVDWHAVDLTANQRYEIKVTGSFRPLSVPLPHHNGVDAFDPRDSEGTLMNPKLVGVYNADGDYNAGTFDDDSGRGRDPRLLFTPQTTGKHYVSVGANLKRGEAAGTYRVRIRATTSRDDCVANIQARTLATGNNCLITVNGG